MTVQRKKTRQDKVNEQHDNNSMRVVKQKFQEERSRKIQQLEAKSKHQRDALEAFKNKPLCVLSGSSGVGKSELMCWWASKLWLEGKIDSIVITRPHQSLGNDYGAVSGNDAMKLLPFCMSMLMKFKKYLGVGILRNNFQMEVADGLFNEARGISIVPVEKIQGLSFNNRTILLADELQNATPAQVKALVTRCEEGAQLICAGDKTQSAIKGENGLAMLERILEKYQHILLY
jgi:phosphate starvation-inducible PhoH-like protein